MIMLTWLLWPRVRLTCTTLVLKAFGLTNAFEPVDMYLLREVSEFYHIATAFHEHRKWWSWCSRMLREITLYMGGALRAWIWFWIDIWLFLVLLLQGLTRRTNQPRWTFGALVPMAVARFHRSITHAVFAGVYILLRDQRVQNPCDVTCGCVCISNILIGGFIGPSSINSVRGRTAKC